MKTFLQSIGDYQILERLGRGGMADVYLALDTRNGRRVALKLVERGPGDEAGEIVAAERLGAQLQEHLCSIDPRIPRIYGYGDLDDFFCIDMEYVEGRDLSECIRSGSIDWREAARIAAELCSILAVSHSTSFAMNGKELRAIVHGDIKPRNIRIDPENRVRVLDFGIAKGLSLTRKLTANYFGSASYSSPERLDTGRIDEMSDLWAVGVVLYEMAGGQPPFEAPSTESLEKMVRARTAPRPLPDHCPLELQQIVFKALAQSPGRRYPNAREFEADLRAFLAGEPTIAAEENEETRRSDALGWAAEAVPAVPPLPDVDVTRRTHAPRKWLTRTRKIAMVAVPAILAVLVVWEAVVFRRAARLAPQMITQELDPATAWAQYQEIKGSSPVGIAPLVLKRPLLRLLLDDCQRVADEYKNSDYPRVREGDWLKCKQHMLEARQLDFSNTRVEAMLALAEGHILRINRKDSEAISAFQRASELNPKWPDPHLGMARTYIYGVKDFQRGTQALERAERLGHKPGKREQAQRADAFRTRGIQYWQAAVRLKDQPQEKELLSKGRDDLENALEMYAEIAPWGESTNQIRAIQELLDKIEDRLQIIDPPGSIFSWRWWKDLK
jgi:hypothetical protein